MNIQTSAANLLLLQSLGSQSKTSEDAGEKTVEGEIKSVSVNKNAILVALPNNITILFEIPHDAKVSAANFTAGEKIAIPLNIIKSSVPIQSLPQYIENPNMSVDKFASQSQTTTDKSNEFSKIAEAVLKMLNTESASSFLPAEKEFTQALLREIEQIIKRLPTDSFITQTLPQNPNARTAEEIINWAATQIKTGTLLAKDFFSLPQILFPTQTEPAPNIQNTQNNPVNTTQTPTQFPTITATTTQATNLPPDLPAINKQEIPPNPQEIRFVQQTTENIKENIQKIIPQFENQSIKNLLNEMVKQISTDSPDTFAFVKVDAKSQNYPNFLPLPLQTQFDSEFTAILSKSFPNLPKDLFVETASIIRNSEKSFILSENVLKNVESILKTLVEPNEIKSQIPTQDAPANTSTTAEPQITNPTQWKVTPSLLANILNYAMTVDTGKSDNVLQNFKMLFTNEKTIESVMNGIKNFVADFEGIEKEIAQTQTQKQIQQNAQPLLISEQLSKSFEKLGDIQNILKNVEVIFKRDNAIEYLLARVGILQNKTDKNPQMPKPDESLRNVLREISEQIKNAAVRMQSMPNSESDEKLTRAFSNLKDLSNSVNNAAQKMDAANLLANRGEFAAGRSEQTILIPVQIGNSWLQMELRVNKDGKGKSGKHKKEASQVEVSVELDSQNTVSAKANLTLEKQLQVAINFSNEKMLEWFKKNYTEFCKSLESVGTKSVQVVFNRNKKAEIRESADIRKSNFELVG